MPTYAVLNNKKNEVVNIIVTDDKEQSEKDLNATLIEYTDNNPLRIGDKYGETPVEDVTDIQTSAGNKSEETPAPIVE